MTVSKKEMFEYKTLEYLEEKVRDNFRRGLGKTMEWKFGKFIYKDVNLLEMLNILGKMSWEVSFKESDNIYILRRRYFE